MGAFTKTIIRCAIDVLAPKSKSFVDDFTGQLPEAWNKTDIELQIAFFRGSGSDAVLLDVTVFESITAQIMSDSRQGDAYCEETVGVSAINTGLVIENWQNRSDQHVKISFTHGEFNLPLGGAKSLQFWLVVFGVTNTVPKSDVTFGGTELNVFEDGVPAPDGPLLGGNLIPALAVYDGAGHYVLNVTASKFYRWTKGANDTDVVNGAQTVNVTDTDFVTQGATITLRGTPAAAITAVIWGSIFLTADESDQRYALKTGDVRTTSVDDGKTYRLDLRIVDGVPVTTWTQVSGGGDTLTFPADDGHTYRMDLHIVDGQATPTFVQIS